MYYSTAVSLLGKIVLKQFLRTQLATQGRGSTTPTSSTVSGELTTAQLAVSSTLQSIATIQPFNILHTMEVLPPGRPFFIYDYSPPDVSTQRRQRRERGDDTSRTEIISPSPPRAPATSSPATQANLPSITILTPSTVHQAATALPMTAPPLASLNPSTLGTSLAAPTNQTLVFPGTGHRSGFLVMLPDPTELVLDFGTLIHGNHPEDDDDDELMLVLFEEDETPSVSWTVSIAMPPQTALPSPHRRSPLQQELHAAASSGLGRRGRRQYPTPTHAEPWLRHWVPIVLPRPATVIPEHERWDSARTILKTHQQDVMMQWYKEARQRMEAYYSRWHGRWSSGGSGSQDLYLSVETYDTEPRMVGLLRSINKLNLVVDAY